MGGHTASASGGRVNDYRRAFLNIAQAPRWRGLLIGTFSLLLVLCIWRANSDPRAPGSRLYQKISGRPRKYQDFMWKPPSEFEPSELTLSLEAGNSPVAPGHLKKENSQFHLLIHAPRITSNVCRSLLSSFLLDYPPPTLVGYRGSLDVSPNPEASSFLFENGIPDVTEFLNRNERINDDDFVLLVDGESTIFQLPTEALLAKYNAQTEKANEELGKEYRDIPVRTLTNQRFQRFNQSVFFAAEYGIVPVPERSFLSRFKLPADPETKSPVHLNNDLIIGSGSGIRRLFTTAADQNTLIERSDRETFNTMYAQQGLLRDTTSQEQRDLQTWLSRNFLRVDDKQKKEIAKDYANSKQDMGMGLDFQATMFQTIPSEARNVAATVIRLNESKSFPVPGVFSRLYDPFTLHESTPHLNSTSAILVQKTNNTLPTSELWTTIPLFTNPKTQQIPSIITLPSGPKLSSSNLMTAPDTNVKELWESMWFHPHARTLLTQYLAKATSKEVASEAAVGGERWWDKRGGRGGAWTVEGQWLDASDLCASHGAELFADGQRGWPYPVPDGVELSTSGAPEKGPDGKGTVIGEVVQGNEIVKVVLVPPPEDAA